MSRPKILMKRSQSESSANDLYSKTGELTKDDNYVQRNWHKELIIKQNIVPKANIVKCNTKKRISVNVFDIGIRVILVIVFFHLETTPPFTRVIQIEEMWLYKNPPTPDYISPTVLFLCVILVPFIATVFNLIVTHDQHDFTVATLAWTLTLCFNGLVTSLLKITVGRPRPDFFYRCFPDGVMHLSNDSAIDDSKKIELFICTGDITELHEGRKSFPSGHSSFAFAGFGFLTFYIASKLHTFCASGRGNTWKLCVSITPLFIATLVAISRTCDYHHHWQDVLVGGIIGLLISYVVYKQYYSSIIHENCDRSYLRKSLQSKNNFPENEYMKILFGSNTRNSVYDRSIARKYSVEDLSNVSDEAREPLIRTSSIN